MRNFGVLGALVWHALSHALSRTGGSSSASSWHDGRLALQEQLETVATDYDQIAGELDARHRPPQPETYAAVAPG
jgi:hypothetical protein